MLLYPVYALLFADAGLSTAQISSLFVVWSLTGIVLEVPSGVLADATSRRRLLVVAPLLSAAGFALWTAVPAYWAFALGFVLWGAQGALASGAFEALLFEELERLGAADRFAPTLGRATAAGTLAAALATGLAAPVLAAGGFVAVGAASVVPGIAAALVARTLPEHRATGGAAGPSGGALRAHLAVLRDGVGAVRRAPALRRAVLLVPAVTVVWGVLDEYLPLLAVEAGAAPGAAPLLVLLVYGGMTAGGLLAGPIARAPRRALAALLAASAALLAAGALSAVPAGFALVALAFCGFQAATVVVEARLQDAVDGPERATVTSVAGLATEVGVVGAFAAYGAASAVATSATLFAAFAATYALVALAVARRVRPRRRPPRPPTRGRGGRAGRAGRG